MDLQELEIVIGRDGQVAISVKGASGPECLALTGSLEKDLGDLVERTHTAEFFSPGEGVSVSDCSWEKVNGKRG